MANITRCSLASFAPLGAVVDGSPWIAAVPALVAAEIRRMRPHLRTTALPFALATSPTELLWPVAVDGDEGARFVRDLIVAIAEPSAPRVTAFAGSKRVRAPRRTSP
jgi:LysR family transcriptional regulator, mexEF-oprN operon transcriptional activator